MYGLKALVTISRRTVVFVLGICAGLIACSIQLRPRGPSYEITDYRVEIRSSTTWTAVVDDGRAVDGEFNQTLDLPDETRPVCAVVTKKTVDGFVRAWVTPGGRWVETDSPNGSVAPCSSEMR